MIEQAMLDLVPLARAGRKMTHVNRHAGIVRKFLKTGFPKSIATSVTSAAVCRDEQLIRFRVKFTAQFVVPSANRFDGKFGGVVIYADIYITDIFIQIINPIRRSLAEFLVDEVVDLHQFKIAFRTSDLAVLTVISDQFLLFSIDGNGRPAVFQKLFRLLVDELELLVAVGIRSAFQ